MNERRLLQVVVVLGCLVPLLAGGFGVLQGPAMVALGGSAGAISHFRYLSGLLFGIGLGFLSTVPHIEAQSGRVRLLAAIVVVGGLGRLYSVLLDGADTTSWFALVMELVVTPALAVWQARIARQSLYPPG